MKKLNELARKASNTMSKLKEQIWQANIALHGFIVRGLRKTRRFHKAEAGLSVADIITYSLITILLGIAVYVIFKEKIDPFVRDVLFGKLEDLS